MTDAYDNTDDKRPLRHRPLIPYHRLDASDIPACVGMSPSPRTMRKEAA